MTMLVICLTDLWSPRFKISKAGMMSVDCGSPSFALSATTDMKLIHKSPSGTSVPCRLLFRLWTNLETNHIQ